MPILFRNSSLCKSACSQLTRALVNVSARSLSSFQARDLEVVKATGDQLRPMPANEKLVFGKEFADHMLEVDWSLKNGWSKPKISPLHNFSLHPASKVFHYAIELFEGMKAYRCVDGEIRLFRPDCNIERMLNSAARSSLPLFEGEELLKCIKELVKLDSKWVPKREENAGPDAPNSTLYLRPTMIGTEGSLGVSVPTEAKLYVITGPVGAYYSTGLQAVSLFAEPKYTRAFEGGCGSYKMGSNYAPTINVQVEANRDFGCQQVLWLHGPEHHLTEVGTMNLFMLWINENGEKELITPPLSTGIILPGVTRRSIIELAKQKGEYKVSERNFGMHQVTKALSENRVLEMFGTGTACVVSPIKEIVFCSERIAIPTMDNNAEQTMAFYHQLQDIQFGKVKHPWMVSLD